MVIKKCIKDSFAVIGKEGSTEDGPDFIKKLWNDANCHFSEVEPVAKKNEMGKIVGVWGAMSDMTRSFKPWEDDFSKGLYLAGIEAAEDARPPEGWVKWIIPGYEYLYVKCEGADTFPKMIQYLKEHNIELAGAVHDFNSPEENGQPYMFFPVRKI